jgi:protoheme IX farnesyltransferase
MRAVSTPFPEAAPPLARTRAADYLELTKPRVAVLVLFTVAAGVWLGSYGLPNLATLVHTLFGTALVAAGASALNQLLERHSDARMHRTENRPLPAGRLQPLEVALFGLGLGSAGVVYLMASLQQTLAALVAAAAFVSYVFLYTPLKKRTSLNTLVGAVPGALPPVIGWTAVRGTLGLDALVLFLILFLWQVPHFLAIAWIYRDDYARAGLRMLPVMDRKGGMTGRQMVSYCLVLVVVSLMPATSGLAGPVYLAGAVVLGLWFLRATLLFARTRSVAQARLVLWASLVYLPALLALLLADGTSTHLALAALWR